MSSGTLYVVGTPIGNLGDLSPRAVATLEGSDLVACEDTRRTLTLLTSRGIKKPLVSYHKFNESKRLPRLMATLGRGGSVALVSDGGTPGISDPGAVLVRSARQAGYRVVPIPGPSAITALLSVSGFDPQPFTFIGFLPHRKSERRRLLLTLRDDRRALLFFESPQRCVGSLTDALEILGNREICLAREMTKLHEEFVTGRIGAALEALSGRAVRGEVAFLVSGAASEQLPASPAGSQAEAGEAPAARVRRLIDAGMDRKEALRLVARESGVSRRDLYRKLVDARQEEE